MADQHHSDLLQVAVEALDRIQLISNDVHVQNIIKNALKTIREQEETGWTDADRLAWWFSNSPKGTFIFDECVRGMKEKWTTDQWRALIDQGLGPKKVIVSKT